MTLIRQAILMNDSKQGMHGSSEATKLSEYSFEPLPSSITSRLCAGPQSTMEGAIFLGKHPGLLKYAIWPILINIAITMVTLAILLSLTAWLLTEVHPWFQGSEDQAADVFWTVIEIIVSLGLIAACLGVSVIVWFIVNGVFGGYFYGKLAFQVEKIIGADDREYASLSFFQEASGALYILAFLVAGNVFAFCLNVIPVIGSIMALVVGAYVTGLLLGLEFMSHSLGMRGKSQREQLSFARKNSPETLGLGGVVFLGQLIPILGAVIHVSATIGGVLLFHRIQLRENQKAKEPEAAAIDLST